MARHLTRFQKRGNVKRWRVKRASQVKGESLERGEKIGRGGLHAFVEHFSVYQVRGS